MKTAGIRVGDLVKCDVLGHIFFAEVKELGVTNTIPRTGTAPPINLRVKPITPNITYTIIAPRQIIAHYKRMKGGRA